MRYLFGFICVLALGVMGCSETSGTGGREFPCTEQGILDAIAEGGGPHTFDCNGPQSVNLQGEIVIDNDVILDGEGNLTVHGIGHHPQRVFSVPKGVKAELRRLTATNGYGGIANEGTLSIRDCVISGNWAEFGEPWAGGGIFNEGEMTIVNSTISGNQHDHGLGGGIYNGCSATLMLVNSTVSRNHGGADGSGPIGGGIYNAGEMTIINSTVSGNRASGFFDIYGGGIFTSGRMSVANSTVTGNSSDLGTAIAMGPSSCTDPRTEITGTLLDGDCARWRDEGTLVSNGYNIESPRDTCGFDQDGTDKVDVTEAQLNLGELADNGGPTMTHALGAGSVAIDHISAVDCGVTTDQRGEPRPVGDGCDVGAFEVQP
jgi:hypothetical protein